MPLPLPRRSKYDRITHEKIAKSIEDDQRDYSDLDLRGSGMLIDKFF